MFAALQNRLSLLRWARTKLMSKTSIVIIGGTGFVGTQLAAELASRGHSLNLLTRRRERKKQVLMLPTLTLNDTDVHDSRALSQAVAGADVVISMAGILNEVHRGDFDKVHADLPRKIVDACCENKIPRLLHIGALGASSNAPSAYLRSKAGGEAAIQDGAQRGLNTTIFRPSVVFGPRDDFINRFATLLAMTPVALPLACAREASWTRRSEPSCFPPHSAGLGWAQGGARSVPGGGWRCRRQGTSKRGTWRSVRGAPPWRACGVIVARRWISRWRRTS